MNDGRDQLSKAEIAKDAVQSGAEAAAQTVGEVATILTRAVGEVASAVGGFATEIFEIRESSRRAAAEHLAGATEDQSKASLNDDILNDPS
ncbi:MAG: hypothetical protein NTX33_09265 [Propionibacteriales bacterium]|nr:hypothetical protein [Propionibacteriales bacterium]